MKRIGSLAVTVFTVFGPGFGLLAIPGTAHAQVFPADAEWVTLLCEGAPMTDLYADENGANAERDIVGDVTAPAGMRAVDASFLYMRVRLDQDPAPGGALRPFSWGLEIDLDGNLTTYEILMLVDGIGGGSGNVTLYRNTTTTLPNDPNDPADTPAVATYPFTTHARSKVAAGSSYGGDPDHFLEFAVPWSDLVPLGLDRDTRIFVWAASSSTSASLNGDFACHDGMTGDPDLDDIVSDPTTGDPVVDTDGDGFTDAEELEGGSDPNDPNSVPSSRLEGGGGCTVGGEGALGFALASLGAALAIRRRRGR